MRILPRTTPVLILCAAVLALAATAALAQAPPRNPFSIGISEAGGPATGITGWILAKQSEFYRALTQAIRAARTDSAAAWTLIGLSFLYGVFHAAGPGHGKAVITAYLVANERAMRRGVAIAFAAAALQALVAIALVVMAARLLGLTSRSMTQAAGLIEQASFAAIALLGLWLVWRKGRALLRAVKAPAPVPAPAMPAASALTCRHGLTYRPSLRPGMAYAANGTLVSTASADCDCGIMHAPDPALLAGPLSWRETGATIIAAGLRPCSGAILVLVFALAQGMLTLGMASALAMAAGTAITTGALAIVAVRAKALALRLAGTGGRGTLAIRALELAAALVVLAFGAGLLMGSLSLEAMPRM